MWDRFRQKEETASSLDRKKLEAWQNSHSASSTAAARGITGGNSQYQYAVRGGPAPRWPPRDVDYLLENAQQQSSSYLSVPPVQAPPITRKPERESIYGRPTSSVYSQPSPEAAVFAAHQLRNDVAYHDPLEISPPSSPDVASPRERPYPGDVSPIEEAPDTAQLAQNVTPKKTESRSNIPMMRRERRKNSDAAMNSLRESKSRDRTTPPRPYGHDVRWDPRTGEPTTSAKGRPSQVNPQEYVQGLTTRVDPMLSSTESRTSPPNPTSFRDRLRLTRSTSTSPQLAPAPRPEWRGASGRTAIVPPVRDNKLVAKLKIPPRSSKTANPGFPVLSPIESNGSGAASSPLQTAAQSPSPPGRDKDSATLSGVTSSAQRPRSPATPPLSEDPVRVNRPLAQGPTAAAPSQPRLRIPSNDKAIRRKPARVSSGQEPESPTPSEYLLHDVRPQAAPTGGPSSERTQPPSRFNTTTYATPNHASTPRTSLDEDGVPLPTHPQLQSTPEVSILSRGRPTLLGYDDSPRLTPEEPVKINLDSPFYTTSSTTTGTKSRPSEPRALTRVIPEGNHSTLSVASVLSPDKSLPPAPPEASAKDRVTELNAQLGALGNRRININTAIRKMTEMMPTDNILASTAVVRKREEEKRKVEILRTELADVERQSYELGLKLHRAYKRLDRDAEYEPTTLWVRRVTG